jgi:hypothetical protein
MRPIAAGGAALTLALALALVAPARSAERETIAAPAVEAAASSVRADEKLPGVRKERTWRFKKSDSEPEQPTPPSAWWRDLARWLAEGGRILIWLLGAAALATVLVLARRWLAVHAPSTGARGARLPSHVGELDIRPESLPADIGAAVKELWLAGERRAALSLLYRGALSRLVHSYEVAIGDASTEGDCVRLARASLPAPRSDFIAALVQVWQLAVYGDRAIATERVLGLCDDFDRLLPKLAAPALATGGARR